jgi:hypothetical protein
VFAQLFVGACVRAYACKDASIVHMHVHMHLCMHAVLYVHGVHFSMFAKVVESIVS